jgi:tetratricopeptide (TPR) repeat protein
VHSRHVLVALLAAFAAVPSAGCAHRAAVAEVPDAPPNIANLDEFEVALNRFVLLPRDAPQREAYRDRMLAFLVGYLERALKSGDDGEAAAALRYALATYQPAELRDAPPRPELAAAAHKVYRAAAKRGSELPALLALAVEQRFAAPEDRGRAVQKWKALEDWLVRGGPFSDEPLLRHEELERALEDVAAAFPSPFVTERLADLYVARYEAATRARSQGRGAGTASQKRIEITGYLLMRLYLRADDIDGAVKSLDRVGLDVAKLKEVLVDATRPRRSARPLLALAEEFVPEPGADPSLPYVQQAWGIVDNLSRRALERHPKDPYVHLLRARTLEESGLLEAAIVHLRQSIDLREDIFEAWQQLAYLEFRHLARLAERDPVAARARLGEVEALHQRAVKLWRDRPLEPGLPEAYFVVAEGLYQSGNVAEAQKLLEHSLGIEPGPSTLDLLGTIEFKRQRLDKARQRYEALGDLAFDSELSQLRWEARARQQLGEIALRQGDHDASTKHFRVALRHTNELLAKSPADPDARAERYVERGRILFFLGDVELAMEDFEQAEQLAPGSAKAFADPLIQVVAHGYYPEAVRIFRRAMSQQQLSDSLKLYFALWLNDMALRQGEAPDSEAVAFLEGYAADGWGKKLARHARGELAFPELLEKASDPGERAEAYFYEGLRRFRGGETDEGKKLMREVIKTEMMGFFEYDLALAWLSAGSLPTEARPPLPEAAARR